MNEPLEDFSFPETSSTQHNLDLLKDELNETRRWMREHVVFEDEEGESEDEA